LKASQQELNCHRDVVKRTTFSRSVFVFSLGKDTPGPLGLQVTQRTSDNEVSARPWMVGLVRGEWDGRGSDIREGWWRAKCARRCFVTKHSSTHVRTWGEHIVDAITLTQQTLPLGSASPVNCLQAHFDFHNHELYLQMFLQIAKLVSKRFPGSVS